MAITNFSILAVLFFCGQTFAASFDLNGVSIHSKITEKKVVCGQYQVKLTSDDFPSKYEDQIPSQFHIKGFDGPATIVKKEATLVPGGVNIPSPTDIRELHSRFPAERTYLPSSAVCKNNALVMSYWSGGNCDDCEAFIKFDLSNGMPSNPEKVPYSEFKALEQGR